MNLYEMLDGYNTNPKNEIRKINSLLKQKVSFDGRPLWTVLGDSFHYSTFNKIEIDLESFYTNLDLHNPIYTEMIEDEILILQYRFLCELIFNLLLVGEHNSVFYPSAKEILQTQELIKNGLQLCGYRIDYVKNRFITVKIDIHSETVAAENKEYSDYIFDYLISKTAKDKEQSLLNLCNKLEATKPVDGYTRHARDYIQFLRHPDERKKIKKYSWFYEKENYPKNLEKLFRILITYIAHLNSYADLNEFDKNSTERS